MTSQRLWRLSIYCIKLCKHKAKFQQISEIWKFQRKFKTSKIAIDFTVLSPLSKKNSIWKHFSHHLLPVPQHYVSHILNLLHIKVLKIPHNAVMIQFQIETQIFTPKISLNKIIPFMCFKSLLSFLRIGTDFSANLIAVLFCFSFAIRFLLDVQHQRIVRRPSRQVRWLCPWARHLTGCFYF